MAAAQVIEEIATILRRQQGGAFIVTGFYLTQDESDRLARELTPDVPASGAIGRYHGIPVFPLAAADAKRTMATTNLSLRYSCVKMNVVD
jgi:hypothetical protein